MIKTGIFFAGKRAFLDPGNELEKLVTARVRAFCWPSANDLTCNQPRFGSRADWLPDGFCLPYPDVPAPRLNEWINPTGLSRYGRGLFLVGREAMEEIAKEAFGFDGNLGPIENPPDPAPPNQPASWGNNSSGSVGLEISFNGESQSRKVYPINPFPLDAPGYQLWVVPVVDVRYRWIKRTVPIDPSHCGSWETLLNTLGTFLGESVELPVRIDDSFGVPDVVSFAGQISPAIAFDAAALSIGCRSLMKADQSIVVQEPFVSILNLDKDLKELPLKIGGSSPEVQLPSKVKVTGPQTHAHYDAGDTWTHEENIEGGVDGASPIHCFTSHYQHRITSSPDSYFSVVAEVLVSSIAEWLSEWKQRTGSVVSTGLRSIRDSAHWDFVSFHVNATDSIHTSATMLPPDFAPRFWFNQVELNYVHSEPTARIEPVGQGLAKINPRATAYDGPSINIPVSGLTNQTNFQSGTAHYQTGHGWILITDDSNATGGGDSLVSFAMQTALFSGSGTATIASENKTIVDPARSFSDLIPGCIGRAKKLANGSYEVINAVRPAKNYIATLAFDLDSSGVMAEVDVNPAAINSPEPFKFQFPFATEEGSTSGPDQVTKIRNLLKLNGSKGDTVLITRAINTNGRPVQSDWFVEDISSTSLYAETIWAVLTSKDGAGRYGFTLSDRAAGLPPRSDHKIRFTWPEPLVEIQPFGGATEDDNGSKIVARYKPATDEYLAVNHVDPMATMIRGEATANFDFDEKPTIENVIGLNGWFTLDTVELENIHQWEGKTGNVLRAELNFQTGKYELRQKDC